MRGFASITQEDLTGIASVCYSYGADNQALAERWEIPVRGDSPCDGPKECVVMSRDDDRLGCKREATVARATPHLKRAIPPATTVASPSHLWQLGPRRGGAAT